MHKGSQSIVDPKLPSVPLSARWQAPRSFKRSRCLIPISGYYEWQNTPSGKQPWYFTAADNSPILTVAGLWDEWKNRETGERLKSCTMIVGEPNEFAADIHDRMPIFLREDQFAPRLRPEAGAEVLKPEGGRR